MRVYRLTKKGKGQVKVASRERDKLLDYLYENKTANLEELKNVVGMEVSTLIRQNIRLGFVEEVTNNGSF